MMAETYNNKYMTIINNLTALTGSEKQIAWATDIRAHFVFETIEAIEEKCGLTELTFDHKLNDARKRVDTVLNENAINKIIDLYNRTQDSKFWIDNRDTMFFQIGSKLLAI